MNELKQDIETDQELLLWKIMVMKFMFTHFTFSFAYLPIIVIVHETVLPLWPWHCMGVNIALHFT